MKSERVLSNVIWRFFERCGAQGVTFIVSLVLARLLEPEVYGTVAIILVITNILQVFIDSGFGLALVQKKDADDLDFSTVFWFNITSCLVIYAGLFVASPYLARFYNDEGLTSLIRVTGLILVISGVKNVQQSYVSRNLMFKKFFFATLGGTIGAAVVGIIMAIMGFGAWALVVQNLCNLFVDTIILWITVKWRPKFCFSFERLKGLFSFGWKLLASSLIDTVYNNVRSLIIGKIYTSADLAFYNKGKTFPNMIVSNINAAIDSVLLPTMSAEQDRPEVVKLMTRKAIKISTYIMMPMMMGLGVCAEPIVRILLTEKWLPAVFYLRIFCFTYAFHPIHTANLKAIVSMGRSDINLVLEILKKIIGIIAVVITMFISVKAMAVSLLVTTLLSQVINSWPNKKLLGYKYTDQLKDMLPQIGLSCLMGTVVFCVTLLKLPDIVTLLIQVPLGMLIYLGGSVIFHIDSFEYILDIAKKYLPKKQKS